MDINYKAYLAQMKLAFSIICYLPKLWLLSVYDCKVGKRSKNRLIILLCTNADRSEKMTPVVIGKSKMSLCRKNVKSLAVTYLANRKEWMWGEIFVDRLKKMDFSKGKNIIFFCSYTNVLLICTTWISNKTWKSFSSLQTVQADYSL